MKTLWILAAAATLAACHNRSEDEVGAAPDRGDTTTGVPPAAPSDTTTMAPDTSTYQPGAVDTTTQPTTPGATGYDTTTGVSPDTGMAAPGADTTSTLPSDSAAQSTSP